MASYRQYIPTHFNEYTPKVSVEDFKQGLVIKQQQYDANLQSIKDAFQQTYGLEMTRDVDKEYMKSKQDEIASAINKYGNMDLANSRNASQLTQMIAPLYKDERILNAVSSTNRIKQLTQAQQKLIDKHPDRYSEFNKQYDLKRVAEYLNSDDPSATYNGPTSPTLYTDYKKVALEIAQKLKPSVQIVDGKEVTRIDPNEILSAMPQDALNQMQLEWEVAGDKITDPNAMRLMFKAQIDDLDKQLKQYDPASPIYAQTQMYKQKLAEYVTASPDHDEDLLKMGNSMLFQDHLAKFAATYAYIAEKYDPAYLEQLRYDHQNALQNARFANERTMWDYKVENPMPSTSGNKGTVTVTRKDGTGKTVTKKVPIIEAMLDELRDDKDIKTFSSQVFRLGPKPTNTNSGDFITGIQKDPEHPGKYKYTWKHYTENPNTHEMEPDDAEPTVKNVSKNELVFLFQQNNLKNVLIQDYLDNNPEGVSVDSDAPETENDILSKANKLIFGEKWDPNAKYKYSPDDQDGVVLTEEQFNNLIKAGQKPIKIEQ